MFEKRLKSIETKDNLVAIVVGWDDHQFIS